MVTEYRSRFGLTVIAAGSVVGWLALWWLLGWWALLVLLGGVAVLLVVALRD